jgi:hypothetical protein
MTRIIIRSVLLLGPGLILAACAQHQPLTANCFVDAPVAAASAREDDAALAATLSTRGAVFDEAASPCQFAPLGGGN